MRVRAWAAAALAVAALAAAGCGGGDDGDDAAAPAPATTAPATTAPATTAPATTAPATTAPATTAPAAPVGPGNAATGKEVFAAAPCAGCHAGLGTRAGFGPKLAGQGLSAAVIRTTIENGRGQMPAGLVEGQDLADVVAYVHSLQ